MLLRSSSTPVNLNSILSPASSSIGHLPCESPKGHHSRRSSFSCHFSPASDAAHDHQRPSAGVRRTRSCGNLHSCLSPDHSEETTALKRSSSRRAQPALETIPAKTVAEEEEEEEEEQEENYHSNEAQLFAGGFGSVGEDQKGGLKVLQNADTVVVPPLFLARGLGIDRVGSGLLNAGGDEDGGSSRGRRSIYFIMGNGGELSEVEMHHRKMVEEDPSNALFLRNYAEFLYQNKGDYKRAEEYYSRAILADPNDGEILSQYAKLVWELHADEERASSYFQQAVHAAPQDSHVLAAYAGFLWDTEDDNDNDGGYGGAEDVHPHSFAMEAAAHNGALASATA